MSQMRERRARFLWQDRPHPADLIPWMTSMVGSCEGDALLHVPVLRVAQSGWYIAKMSGVGQGSPRRPAAACVTEAEGPQAQCAMHMQGEAS